jgi:hypothetical protein
VSQARRENADGESVSHHNNNTTVKAGAALPKKTRAKTGQAGKIAPLGPKAGRITKAIIT